MSERIETTLAQIGNRSENITGTVNPPSTFQQPTDIMESGNQQGLITSGRGIRRERF